MHMLQPGYELRFRFKSTDKVRRVSETWQDNLDRHLASNRRLVRPVNGAKTTGADAFN